MNCSNICFLQGFKFISGSRLSLFFVLKWRSRVSLCWASEIDSPSPTAVKGCGRGWVSGSTLFLLYPGNLTWVSSFLSWTLGAVFWGHLLVQGDPLWWGWGGGDGGERSSGRRLHSLCVRGGFKFSKSQLSTLFWKIHLFPVWIFIWFKRAGLNRISESLVQQLQSCSLCLPHSLQIYLVLQKCMQNESK